MSINSVSETSNREDDESGGARSRRDTDYSLFVTQNSLPSGSAQTVQWNPAMS